MIRRLAPLALAVTALLAVVALAAHGRPLGSGAGTSSGLPAAFWDYAFTSFLILLVVAAFASFAALLFFRRDLGERQVSPARTLRSLVGLILVAAVVAFVGRHINLSHLIHPQSPPARTTGASLPTGSRSAGAQHVRFRWDELAVVLGLLLVGGALAATRRRLPRGGTTPSIAPELLAAALDESLDDLRAEPDLRRAIVAAYFRMERTLAAAGLPRHPAEAPLEYVERALLSLDASASAVRRLTDLFEWARFSHHEPEPWMRDEAIDALVAVRDGLRAAEPLAT